MWDFIHEGGKVVQTCTEGGKGNMRLRSIIKQWSPRAKSGLAALLFFVAYTMSAVVPFMPAAGASALDTGWQTPTATHAPNNWGTTTFANIQTSDNNYHTGTAGKDQGYSFSLPALAANAVINGIEVSAEAKSTDNTGCQLGVALSWNGGTSYSNYQNANLGSSDATKAFGGTSDTWGHTWAASELSGANFVAKVLANDPDQGSNGNSCDNAETTSVDVLTVRVNYTVPVTPVANPTLPASCGLDIALVIDNSTSISSTEMGQMKTALTSFTNALAGTPTEFSVTRFATTATVLQPFTDDVTAVNTAINGVPTGGGYTNWEDGLIKAKSTLPNRTNPDLVIFATDGDPTTSNTVGGTDTNQPNAHLDPAITAANSVKSGGARMLALGIGLGNDAGSVSRLKQISGPNADTGNVLTSDVITTDFSTLASDLAKFAEQTCGGTITTQKLIDQDGNLQTTQDQVPASGWTFDVNGGSNPAATVTDSKGLTPAVKVDAGNGYSVNETVQSGYGVIGASCTGASTNGTWNGGAAVTGMVVASNNVVRCTFINTLKKGHITVHKVTNPAGDSSTFSVTASGSGAITGNATRSISTAADVTYEVVYGTYGVTEAAATGWSPSYSNCANIVVNDNNPNPTCTITNTKLGSLTIVKDAQPNDAQDFGFTTSGNGLSSFSLDDDSDATLSNTKVFSNLSPGSYSVTEGSTPGWQLTGLICSTNNYTTNNSQVSVTLAAGQNTTCTFTNTKLGSLSGVKYEVNADKSIVTPASGWLITLLKDGVSTGLTQTTGANGSYSFGNLLPGNYSVSETMLGGWTQVYSPVAVAIGAGQNATGQNFGNFKNGSISGYKFDDHNGNGSENQGDEHLSGWTMTLYKLVNSVYQSVDQAVTNQSGNYSFTNLAPGSYSVCETAQSGWTQTYPANNACQMVAIDKSGESNTGVSFGNQPHGTLTVIKNTDDGLGNVTKDVSGWTWNYDGKYQSDGSLTASSSNEVTVPADTYAVSENAQDGYHFTSVSCTNNGNPVNVSQAESFDVWVGANDTVVCTYLNTHNKANITVTKIVHNDNGGTADVSDFNLYVNKTQVTSGDANGFLTDQTYDVSEQAKVDGYQQTSLNCWLANDPLKLSLDMPFTLHNGQDVNCEIVNDDIAPKLTVYKYVYNGVTNMTKTSSDFTMNVDGTNVSDSSFPGSWSGTTVTLNAGEYSVSEGAHDGYDMYTYGDCSSTIAIGEHNYCYIENDAIEDPQINVVKSGPAAAHEGDTVDYTFTVTNPGNVPFPAVDVDDDIAGAGSYVSGDTNDNQYLDPGEAWLYTASYTIPAETTSVHNTVTACGSYGYDDREKVSVDSVDNGYTTVCATDDHTLTVLHPSISVVKTGPANVQLGKSATYTFTVTNTGDTPLDITKVMDNIAGVGAYVSGDTNSNGLLDLNETWVYTANYATMHTGSITNTVQVCGVDELKLEVCATANHTTIVYVPQVLGASTTLENTGSGIAMPLLLSTGVLGISLAVMLQQDRRKRSLSARFVGYISQPFEKK